MGSGLTVSVSADITDLRTQMAIGKAEMKDAGAAVRSMASDYASASDDMKASLLPALQSATAEYHKLQSELRATQGELAKLSEEANKETGIFSGLSERVAITGETFEKMSAKISVFTKAGAAMSEFVLAGLALERVGEFVGEFAEKAEALGKLAAVTGLTTEQLSGLHDIALMTSTPIETVDAAFQKLTRTMQEAADSADSKAGRAFAAMGVAVTDATGHLRPLGSVLDEVAAKLATYQDGAAKSALEQAVFGKTATELNAYLNELGRDGLQAATDKSKQLGTALSGEASEGAKTYEEHVKQLDADLRGMSNTIMTAVLPALNAMAKWMAPSLDEQIAGLKEQIDHLKNAGFLERAYMAADTNPSTWLSGHVDTLADLQKRLDDLIAKKKQLEDDSEGRNRTVFKQPEAPKPGSVPAPTMTKTDDKGEQTQVEQWKAALNEMQISDGQFHAMSAAQEAAYWKSKIALTQAGSKERAQVIEMYEEKARQAQSQSAGAARKSEEEQWRDFSANIQAKIAAAKGSFDTQIKLAQEWAAEGAKLYGQDTAKYREATEAVIHLTEERLAAQKKAAEEADKIARLQAEAQAKYAQIGQKPLSNEFKVDASVLFDSSSLTAQVAAQVAQLRSVLDGQLAELKSSIRNKIEAGDVVSLEGAYQEMVQALGLIKTFADQSQEINAKAAEAVSSQWSKAMAPIGAAFDSQIDAMLRGQETFRQAALRVVGQVLEGWIKSGLQMAAHWAAAELSKTMSTETGTITRTAAGTAEETAGLAQLASSLGYKLTTEAGKTAATTAGVAARTSAEVSGAAASKAAQAAINGPTILADAAKAAAGAYSAVAGIPIVGPILAPAAAAVAYGAVAAWGSIASAEGGWGEVPADGSLAVLHKQEMVLPRDLASGVRAMVAGGARTPQMAGVGSVTAGAGGGAGTTVNHNAGGNLHYSPQISMTTQPGGLTKSDVQDMLASHSRDMTQQMYDYTRNGTLKHYGR